MQFQILLTYLQGKVSHPERGELTIRSQELKGTMLSWLGAPLKEKPKNPNKQSERRTNIAKTR